MESFKTVQKAIDFIEENIYGDLDYQLISKSVYTSSYHLQRLFSLLCNLTLGEYIRNRRLTLAGQEIVSTDEKVIDVALKFGYETHESFTRAFTRFHGITPMMARNQKCSLNSFSPISIKSMIEGKNDVMSDFSKRGYLIKENGPVYFTKDMDATGKWFRDVLGWYDEVDARNEDGKGIYGCVSSIPYDIASLHIMPFTGIHMLYGDPKDGMLAFMQVQGIDELYTFVKNAGWNKITEIEMQPWGSRICDVTTLDGGFIRFFE